VRRLRTRRCTPCYSSIGMCFGRNVGLVADVTPAKRGRRLPTVLSFSEVRSILTRMRGVPRLCASLMYGSGLRLSECAQLRVKDIDFERAEVV